MSETETAFTLRSLLFGLLIVIGVVIAIPVLIIGTWVGWGTWKEYSFNRNTPIAANLYGQWDSMRDRFRSRLRQQFPPGTPIDRVVASLRSQGFKAAAQIEAGGLMKQDAEAEQISALPPTARTSIIAPSAVCNIYWIVGWDADAERRLKAIYGDLRGYCL